MIEGLHLFCLLLYSLAALLLVLSLARGDRRLPRFATWVVALALTVHLGALAAYTARWEQLPLVGLGPVLSTLALLIGLGSLAAALLGPTRPLGLVLVPMVALLVGVAAWVGIEPVGEPMAFGGIWFVLHVVFAVIGYAGLTLAFAAGLMYLLQFRELKSKRFGAIFRFFPPLETLDSLGRRGLLLGFPFLSLALVLGWAWTVTFQRSLEPRNPQVIWGVITWAVFVGALLARLGGGRRAHRAALASVVGFLVVVVAYLLLRVQLSRGGVFL
ncbi:MAG TPA: cytochrome c biogenesis protein CcsA [Longimicrobiaceae bacterium]|nr:cytochrome c biogenesis protein CcsA [Longimicrobiaceae bacterium]